MEGAYTQDAAFSLAIMSFRAHKLSKASPHCRWGVGAKRVALPGVRQRDAPGASVRLTKFNVEGQGSRAIP